MALTQISTGGIKDDAVTDAKLPANSVGNSEMKDDAVGVAELSATGTASSSTFLRGDNSWVTPTDTNTQLAFANDANDRVVTGDGSGGLNGEANLTFDGNNLDVSGGCITTFGGNSTNESACIKVGYEGSSKGQIRVYGADASTTGSLEFKVSESDGTDDHTMLFDGNGDLGIGTAPNNIGSYHTLHIKGPSGEGAGIRLQDNGDTADSDDFTIYKNSAAGYLRVNGSDPLIAYLNGAERFKVESSGNVTISDGDLVIGTAGHGIDFSATSDNAGQSSELLDDYEEGLYQPSVTASTSGDWGTSSYTYLAYTKIGRVVFVSGYINISADNSANGDVKISLPFTAGNFTENADSGSLTVSLRAHNNYSDLYNVSGVVLAGQANMEIVSVRANGTHMWVGQEHCDSSFNVRVGGFYFT